MVERLHPAARVALAVYCRGDRAMEEAVATVLSSSGCAVRTVAREIGVDRATLARKARKFAELLAEAWRREKLDPRQMIVATGNGGGGP